MKNDKQNPKELFKTTIEAYQLSRDQVLNLIDEIFQEKGNTEKFLRCPEVYGNPLLCVDKNLRVTNNFIKAVAIVDFFKDDKIINANELEGLNLQNKLVNIAFIEPIAKYKTLYEGFEEKRQWTAKNYPMYHSTLISYKFYLLLKKCNLNLSTFKDCFTRNYEAGGYPNYRKYAVEISSEKGIICDCSDITQNVYVSLVMKEKDFLKINPEIVWDKYASARLLSF